MAHLKNRNRRWAFTVNNYSSDDVEPLKTVRCQYLIYGREQGEQGTVHLQGYIVFKNPVRFQRLQKLLPRAHWEAAVKGHQANINYCKKDGMFWERGSLPTVQSATESSLLDLLKEQKPKDYMAHINGIRFLRGVYLETSMLNEIRSGDLTKPYVIYIHGASGSGKTYTGYTIACGKYPNEEIATLDWRNGFAISNNFQAKCLILPEFRPSTVDAATFLQFTDGYGMVLNVKHGHVYIRPEMIIICSIKPPTEIYKEEINHQFLRRISEVMNKDADPYIDYTDTESDGGKMDTTGSSEEDGTMKIGTA